MAIIGYGWFGLFRVARIRGPERSTPPWQILEANLDGLWHVYACNPPLAFRSVAVAVHSRHASAVQKVHCLSCGIALVLKTAGSKLFLISAHLPHRQRDDCIQAWQTFNSELDNLLASRRLHDTVVLMLDTNYELGPVENMLDPNLSDERGFLAATFLSQHGFVATSPSTHTWSNSQGSVSKIDFICVSVPTIDICSQSVNENSDYILGCDHRAVTASFLNPTPSRKASVRPPRAQRSRCGQWRCNLQALMSAAKSTAEHLEETGRDLNLSVLQGICNDASRRPVSYRYKDPPHILQAIKHRRSLHGSEARQLGKDILRMRAQAKQSWLTHLLDKGSKGDYGAISYFRKRQSTVTQHTNYIVRAGGVSRAVSDLKTYYRHKYTAHDLQEDELPLNLFLSRIPRFHKPDLISVDELSTVLSTCKTGSSAGDDGITYEMLHCLAQSELAPHIVDLFNAVLFQVIPPPQEWLISKITFIPKIKTPSLPQHLRPIVLSSTVGKLFTKILLFRIRPHFPLPSANQIACIKKSQTLDGSVCLQHLIRLSQEYRLPLVAVKLDISSAFDHISHSAVASYLSQCGPQVESLILLKIIVLSRVVVGIADSSWQQKLYRGLLQGTSYSAEIFGRTLDYFLGFLDTRWNISESTWIQAEVPDGVPRKLFNLLYADDIVLLATSIEQARRLLEGIIEILGTIGLTLALGKCKFIHSPDISPRPIVVRSTTIHPVRAFKFLGILMGFDLNCQTILSARLTMANNTFWGYYRILRRPAAPVRKRLQLLNTYVTSKWRWMSPCVRPVSAVVKMLNVMHTTLLTSLCGLSSDPFLSPSINWVVRRRASKMIAQVLQHQSWSGLQALSFMSYWGHAARIFQSRFSPICLALRIRNTSWLHENWRKCRRQLGFWPNSFRYIQLQWEQYRPLGSHPFWEVFAQDRIGWKNFVSSWLKIKNLDPLIYYTNLETVDLGRRSLLQIDEKFSLLPFRQPPFETDYDTSFSVIISPAHHDEESTLRVCSDGSSKDNKGALAVTFLAPYAPLSSAVVVQAKVSDFCTNIRAELRAAIQAFKMIRQSIRFLPHMHFYYMTDSMYVLQSLEEHSQFSSHPHDRLELCHLWKMISSCTTAYHVRGHSGHPLNTLTDTAAKEAMCFRHDRTLYRTADYGKVFLTSQLHPSPPFPNWL